MAVADDISVPNANTPKVSVVIPLYYAEDYIDDLLIQLREQPLREIEIICVIDGSPDGTLNIVKRHAEEDGRIQWLYQENAGAGSARNAGLERACGEYLAFLDADDLYDEQFLSRMYETAVIHDADLVLCQCDQIDCKTDTISHGNGFRFDRVPVDVPFSPLDLKDAFLDIFVIPQNKLFKKEMVDREGLRFSTTQVNNDNFFVLASIAASMRIVAIAESLLVVRRYVNNHSISSNRALHIDDMFGNFQDLYSWLAERNLLACYNTTYLNAWATNLHYGATYERNERFIELAAKTLAEEEPWRGMSDGELSRAARLNLGIISIKKLVAAQKPDASVRAIEDSRLDNASATIAEIIRILNTEYGKNLPSHPSKVAGIGTYLRDNGIRFSVTKLVSHLMRRGASATILRERKQQQACSLARGKTPRGGQS